MMHVMKRRGRFSDEIRKAIDASGMSRYRVCKATGIAQSTMSAFMAGKRGLSLDTLDTVAELLDIHITTGKARKGR